MLVALNPVRLHPLLVHLPIGLLFFALMMQCLQWWAKDQSYRSAISFSLLLGAITAVFSVLSGWGLATEGGYEEGILDRHRWLGIGVAVGAVLAYVGQLVSWRPAQRAYPLILILTNGMLVLAGHYGGVMTHGADYLFSSSAPEITVANIQEAEVYEVVIAPLLAQKCTGCHKASKSKGDLRMDAPEYLLAGGESGSIFDEAEPTKSLLLERIHLPLEEEEHMPPEGKPQLSSEELSLLRWWIENDHCFDCQVKDLPLTAEIELALKSYEAPQDHWSRLDLAPLTEKELASARRVGIKVQPLAEDSPWLMVDLAREQNINKNRLRALRPLRKHIISLHAGFSNWTDAEAGFLASCKNLRKLELQGTEITDGSLRTLKKLKQLESLNLYQTKVTDEGLAHLMDMPSLRQVYLWQSEVSEARAVAMQEQVPALQVLFAPDDDIFGRSALNPPVLEAATTLFTDSVVVRLRSNLQGVSAYYTLDGSPPDTASNFWPDSLVLRESAQLKVIQTKEGWLPSPVTEKGFVKAGIPVAAAELITLASGKYIANGAQSLIDLEKGSSSFTDGKWLGYEGKHLAAVLDLGQVQSPKVLSLSMLSRPASWIFFPKGVKVYASANGSDYQLVQEAQWPSRDKEIADEEMQYFRVPLPAEIQARYLKVEVESPLRNPDWHPNPGGNSWIFIDEILVD